MQTGIDVTLLAIEPVNGQVCLRADPSEKTNLMNRILAAL